jgi:hypothetical protein
MFDIRKIRERAGLVGQASACLGLTYADLWLIAAAFTKVKRRQAEACPTTAGWILMCFSSLFGRMLCFTKLL